MATTTNPRPKFVLETTDGRWATFDMRSGPSVTAVKALRYTWESKVQAEWQRPLYERALGVAFVVKED